MRLKSREERGVATVFVAMLAMVLIGFASLAMDYAMAISSRHSLISATDSAASLAARNCALHLSGCDPSNPSADVSSFLSSGSATADVVPAGVTWSTADALTIDSQRTISTPLRAAFFSEKTTVATRATYSWNYVATSGVPLVPFGIDWCTWNRLGPTTGNRGSQTTFGLGATLSDTSLGSSTCTGVPGEPVTMPAPSLNGYVLFLFDAASRSCPALTPTTTIDVTRVSNSGFPDAQTLSCATDQIAALKVGHTVFVPIYTVEAPSMGGTWANLSDNAQAIRILGYAPIYIDGFVSTTGTELSTCQIATNCVGIDGYFVRTTREFSGWTYTHVSPEFNFGAVRVTRTG